MNARPRGIFVVGTDTGVGKTRVAGAIARAWVRAGYRVGVLKPVSTGGSTQDGSARSDDATALIAAISTPDSPFPPPPHDQVAPLIYPLPLAPVMAAREAGTPLEPATLVEATRAALDWWQTEAQAELMVVEGVGGLLCPVAEAGWTLADLAVWLDFPLIIVAHRDLGTLNQTLLTAEAARARGLRVAGIILNGVRPVADPLVSATNAAVLASHLHWAPVLAEWPFQATDQPADEPDAAAWVRLADSPRRPLDLVLPATITQDLPATDYDLTRSSQSDPEIPALNGLTRPGLATTGAAPAAPPAADPFLGLNLATPPAPVAAPPQQQPSVEEIDPAAPWKQALLVSYASAMTLALIYTLYQGRRAERLLAEPVKAPVAETHGGESGRLNHLSRRLAPLPAIPDDQIINLGQSRQIGSLLIEPLAIERRDLILERVNLLGKTEQRDGGKQAIALRIRLLNKSSDQVFAPVDPAFVRNRADAAASTLLELTDGQKFYPGTLAVDSEWHQVGESFEPLRPGESREVVLTTEANAPEYAERLPGVWRLKLRTGIDSTTIIGVRLPDRTKI